MISKIASNLNFYKWMKKLKGRYGSYTLRDNRHNFNNYFDKKS